MTSKWAAETIQKLRLNCAQGAGGNCEVCQKGIEDLILEVDKRRSQLEYLAHVIIQLERNDT